MTLIGKSLEILNAGRSPSAFSKKNPERSIEAICICFCALDFFKKKRPKKSRIRAKYQLNRCWKRKKSNDCYDVAFILTRDPRSGTDRTKLSGPGRSAKT